MQDRVVRISKLIKQEERTEKFGDHSSDNFEKTIIICRTMPDFQDTVCQSFLENKKDTKYPKIKSQRRTFLFSR